MAGFQKFLLDVANNLTRENVDKIKFLLGARDYGIGQADLERVEDGRALLELLQKRNLLSKDNLTLLQKLLESAQCKDLASKVKIQKQFKAGSYHGQKLFVVPYFQETKNTVELTKILESHDTSALVGPVGCGKSQLSYWYAEQFMELHKDALVWKFQCQSLEHLSKTMKSLLEYLDIELNELMDDKDEYVLKMAELISTSFKNSSSRACLLLFDDVQKPCLKDFSKLLINFREVKDLKIIITSNNSQIDHCIKNKEECCIYMTGMSVEEAVTFFRSTTYFKDENEDSIRELSRKLGHLPLGLFTARSYIQQTRISINKYIRHLDDEDFLKSIDETHLNGEYNKGLMASQLIVLEELKSIIPPVAYKFLYYVPLLDYEHIPIFLLYSLLPSHLSDAEKTVQVGAFVQGLSEYSLGEVCGIDDDRVISFHGATNLAMSLLPQFTDSREKHIWKLVKILCSSIDMDGRRCMTLSNNLLLLEHASKVLQKSEKFLEKTDEVLVLSTYLSCALGVSYRLKGCDDFMAHQFLMMALQTCLKLIGKDETFLHSIEVDPDYGQKDVSDDKVECMYDLLVRKSESISHQFYQNFVENKIRSERDIEHLIQRSEGLVRSDDFVDRKINSCCHKKLVSLNLAMPYEMLQRYFLIELLMSVLYNNGRNFYRMKHSHNKSKNEILADCRRYFYISFQLNKAMKGNCGGYIPVQSLIAERNGSLYLLIRDTSRNGQPVESVRKLNVAIERYRSMLNEKSDYFEFGVLKMGPHFNQHHVGMCYKFLLKCYIKLYDLVDDQSKEVCYKQGAEIIRELEQLENQLKNWIALAGFYVQMAKFYRLIPTLGNLNQAVAHLRKAIELENRNQEGTVSDEGGLSHFMLQAKFNIIDCLIKIDSKDSIDEANKICEEFVNHLRSTNREQTLKNALEFQDTINQKINLDA